MSRAINVKLYSDVYYCYFFFRKSTPYINNENDFCRQFWANNVLFEVFFDEIKRKMFTARIESFD